jgi:hypothetical protein
LDLFDLVPKHKPDLYDGLLTDNNWQHARFYRLDSGSVFWNTASIISLQKTYADTAEAALLYLLQKEAHFLSLWPEEWQKGKPTAKAFIDSVIAGGCFTNTKGEPMAPENFREKFSNTMDGLMQTGVEYFIDGVVVSQPVFFDPNEIIRVICFDDSWQEQNYFIEANTEWILYHWAGGA